MRTVRPAKPGQWAARAAALASLVLVVSLAARADQGSPAGTERATELFKWINFAIVGGLIGWVFVRLLPPLFRKNAERIGSAIAQATAAKNSAEAELREAESRLANLQKEILEWRTASVGESAAELERLGAATRSEIGKIEAAAKAEIESTERAARMELKALAARLAVEGAESLLVKQLTPKAQESLISHFVKSLEGKPN